MLCVFQARATGTGKAWGAAYYSNTNKAVTWARHEGAHIIERLLVLFLAHRFSLTSGDGNRAAALRTIYRWIIDAAVS